MFLCWTHLIFASSPQMLKLCVLSAQTLEVMLNTYSSVPPCEWMDSLSSEIYEVSCRSPCSLNHLFSSCYSLSTAPVIVFFLPCLRSSNLFLTWCVGGAVSLVLCSISVDVLCACTSEPSVTQPSVNWTFPAL